MFMVCSSFKGLWSRIMPLHIGEIVKLNSGGPALTVTAKARGKVTCTWFDNGAIRKAELPLRALKPAVATALERLIERTKQIGAASCTSHAELASISQPFSRQ
jgi:uncharacterized protein YodC (DUF2158 family)